ncbi:MAG TPA: LON peptidase substrate-binding domain-containing protein, partial [Actinomycetota bacterium]|nr:LON peptidase substrate-binding domain-containing protein [Actinomycetota bacterium]
MSETKTQTLPLLPLKEGVILPHMVVTISVDSESSDESFEAIAAARRSEGLVLLVPRVEGQYARIGTVAKLEDTNPQRGMAGEEVYIVRGLYRAVVGRGVSGLGNATWVEAETAEDPHIYPAEVHNLAKEYRALVENILEMRGERQVARFLRGINNPGHLADTSGYSPYLTFEQKKQVLETTDVKERLEQLLVWNRETLADFSLKDKIHKDVAEGMEKTQREFLLRQQMEAIRKELGEEGDDVVAEYRAKFDKINMPDDIRKEVNKELDRLERTSAQNPEQGYIRNYLDWMVELP